MTQADKERNVDMEENVKDQLGRQSIKCSYRKYKKTRASYTMYNIVHSDGLDTS